ncbi:hypothetical protein GGR51DRAFT_544216 [Nemania sp. FL0031]|nr:hypothetical protein GGR51DRAFT_544216 [Nemania sp. FL0031]
MIRQSLNSATGRSRAELTRVTDGIAASLRAFSTAQRLAAPPPQDGSSNGDSPRPSGRQRAAAAYSDLADLNNSNGNRPRPSGQSGFAWKKIDLRPESATSTTSTTSTTPGAPSPRIFNRIDLRSESATISVPRAPTTGAPNIIRGGFRGGFGGGFRGRGRGGFNRGGAMAGAGRPGGTMGQGRRRGGGERSGGGGRGGRKRDRDQGDDQADAGEDDWSPEVKAMWETKEVGTLHQFNPSLSRSDLVGYGPGAPIDGSSAAKDDAVLQQARILGGAQGFRSGYTLRPWELRDRYKSKNGTGVFFPNEEVKKWSLENTPSMKLFRVFGRTKKAVLQAALLGTHKSPRHADLEDTLGTVRSYAARGATWNADASRRIEEKVRSLLPGGSTGPAGATGGPRARA